MLNRRELMASTVALSVAAQALPARAAGLAAGGKAGSAGPAAAMNDGPAKYFIAARDVPEAHPAARAAAARGATVIWLGPDVTPVYTRLDLALRPAPCAVAGLTSAHQLFVLERLGWDRGLRTVRRTERHKLIEWRLEPKSALREDASARYLGV